MLNFEEIRKKNNLLIKDFCNIIGCTPRTYQYRVTKEQLQWKLDEVITIAEMNKNQVLVDTTKGSYEIRIKKVK